MWAWQHCQVQNRIRQCNIRNLRLKLVVQCYFVSMHSIMGNDVTLSQSARTKKSMLPYAIYHVLYRDTSQDLSIILSLGNYPVSDSASIQWSLLNRRWMFIDKAKYYSYHTSKTLSNWHLTDSGEECTFTSDDSLTVLCEYNFLDSVPWLWESNSFARKNKMINLHSGTRQLAAGSCNHIPGCSRNCNCCSPDYMKKSEVAVDWC